LIDPSLDTTSAGFEARLAESTREVARLAEIAMHPQMRAAIVTAKSELQRIAFDRHAVRQSDIRALLVRLHDVEARLGAVRRALEVFGPDTIVPRLP
jgi:hypothetical protein